MSGKTNDVQHSGLGVIAKLIPSVPSKAQLMDALKLGIGATVGITGTDLLISQGLPRLGVMVPIKWAPLVIAAGGILGAPIAKQFVGEKIAAGVVAGTVGLALSQVVKSFTAPAAAATEAAANNAEVSGYGPQAVAGFGAGRAFANGLGGFAGLLPASTASAVYGVGTPDMSANRMFNGATVAIEESGPVAGATVQFEDASAFAGILN